MISWSGWWSQVDDAHDGLEHRLKVSHDHCVDDAGDDGDDAGDGNGDDDDGKEDDGDVN